MPLDTLFISIHDIGAIDVHAHYGTVNWGKNDLHNRLTTADAPTVLQRSLDSNIQYTVVSPILGFRGCAELGRDLAGPGPEQYDALIILRIEDGFFLVHLEIAFSFAGGIVEVKLLLDDTVGSKNSNEPFATVFSAVAGGYRR